MSQQLLVTGASGALGQRVVHHLLHTLGVAPSRIVAASRHPSALSALAGCGVRVVAADFDDADTLPKAFEGVDRLLLISTDAIDRPGARLRQHRAAVAAAEAAGVRHLVYTSMPQPKSSTVLFAPDHAGTEDALAASRLPGWTVLRNHWYFENLFMSLPGVLAAGGRWFSAAGDGKLANIARDDLALAAATVLAGSEAGRHTYTLSGGQALTTAEQAAAIAQVLGRPVEVIPVPVEGLVQGMVGAGLPGPLAQVLASFDTNTAAGHVGQVTGDYQAITGRAPQRFADWLQAHRQALAGQ